MPTPTGRDDDAQHRSEYNGAVRTVDRADRRLGVGLGVADSLPRRVGGALVWRAAQLGGERGIALLRFLVLARILAPEAFGLLAIAAVTMDLLAGLTNVGMRPALVQRTDLDTRHYDAAWSVGLVRACLISAVALAAAPWIADFFSDPAATGLLRLIALRPIVEAMMSIRTTDLERSLDYRSLAFIQLPAAVTHTLMAVALAPTLGVQAVVWGMLAGALVEVVTSYALAPHRPRPTLQRAAVRDLIGFGRWILATSIIAIVTDFALSVVISRQLGTAELGLYYLAWRLVRLPDGLVSSVIGAVAFPLHARLQNTIEPAVRAFQSNVKALLATLLAVYLILGALAPGLVTKVLGSKWEGTVPVVRLLAVAAVLGILADAAWPLFEGRGAPHLVTIIIAVRFGALMALMWPLTEAYGLAGAALAIVLSEVLIQLTVARFTLRMLPASFRGLGTPLAATAGSAALGAMCGFFLYVGLSNLGGVIIASAVAFLVYALVLRVLDRRLELGLVRELATVFPVFGRWAT